MQGRESARIGLVEAEALETLLTALIHIGLQLDDTLVTLEEAGRLEAAGGEEQKRVEDLLVQPGGVLQRLVPRPTS